ncbi:hypothetical protein Bca101_043008 [Brassica carinata]
MHWYPANIFVYDTNDQAMFVLLGVAGRELTRKHASEMVDKYFEKISLSASPVSQTSVTDVRHSTFESLRLGRSCQSIIAGRLRFWDSLNFKKDSEFMSHVVGQIRSVQGSDLTKETTRVIIRLLIDP